MKVNVQVCLVLSYVKRIIIVLSSPEGFKAK